MALMGVPKNTPNETITQKDIQAKTFCDEMNKFFGQKNWNGSFVHTLNDGENKPVTRCHISGNGTATIKEALSISPYMLDSPESHAVVKKGFDLGAKSADFYGYKRGIDLNPQEIKFKL